MTESLREKQILEDFDRESQRVGQELHDGLCQRLRGLAMIAEATRDSGVGSIAFYKGRADKLASELNRAIQEVRNLARGLYPVRLDSRGLRPALEELAASYTTLFDIHCEAAIDELRPLISDTTVVHVYRIAQEAVSNAARHGKAKCIMIAFLQSDQRAKLIVRDDGIGFDVSKRSSGMGIRSMEHRATVLSASLEIQSKPGEGTIVTCEFVIE